MLHKSIRDGKDYSRRKDWILYNARHVYFKLTGDNTSRERREALGKILGIGYGNATQMVSRLNNYGISKEEFSKAIEEIEKQLEAGNR